MKNSFAYFSRATGQKLISFISRHKIACIALLTGGVLWIASSAVQSRHESIIPPVVSLLNYTAYFSLLTGLFQLFNKANKLGIARVFVFAILLLVLEVVCFFLLGMPTKEHNEFISGDVEPDHIAARLGGVPFGDSVLHSVKYVGQDICFDVHYTINSECIRVTPGYDSTRNEHALFFGCSIAFGEGLEDNQTLAYNFQQASDTYNAYNYAFSGYGTNHMLARLQYQDLSEHVKEENGTAFYVFFWDHIYRSIGAMSRYTKWGHDAPYYTLENGKPIRNGSFKNGRFASKIFEEIYQLNTLKYFDVDFPLKLNDSHYQILVALIKESKAIYEKQFKETEFYVLLYPTYEGPSDWSFVKFKKMLDKENIKYIDLFNVINFGPEHTLVGDGHPNKETSELIGKELFKRILEMK